MPLGMKIFTGVCVVLVVLSLLKGFFHKFRTHSSQNFYSNAEYGTAGPPENYGQNGIGSKIKSKMGKGGGGASGGGAPPAA